MVLRIGLLGAGRIGKVHAQTIARNRDSALAAVADVVESAAQSLADEYGSTVMSAEQIIADPSIDAILIATSTDTHADLLHAGLAANKSIFCEKPVDLDLNRAAGCQAAVERSDQPAMMAFNRRFDPNFRHLKSQIDADVIGRPDLAVLTSFDPAPPPIEYIKVSGGLFRDMMIHDFDVACWLMDGMPEAVTAHGSCLVDPAIGEAGDVDTASVTLQFDQGRVATILNSRRAAYGYDQRIEVLGSKGSLSAGNVLENTVVTSTEAGVTSAKPEHFFLERYMRAYEAELDEFIDAVVNGNPVPATVEEGVNALVLAAAAERSMKEGRTVPVAEIRREITA